MVLLAACGSRPDPDRTAALAPPQRVVSLAPALTEILFALEAGDRVAGVTTYCDWPEQARTKPKVGGFADPSIEAVLALEPDLVLASPGPGNREAVLAVERAGRRVVLVPAETLEDTYRAIETIARLCAVEGRGERLIGRIRERIDAVARSAANAPRVRTLFCVQVDPIIVAGAGTLPSELLELAGGENVVTAPRYPRLGIESVLAAAPEVIVQARMDAVASDNSAGSEGRFWRRWSAIPAVHDGRVYVRDLTPALRAGPRIADAVEMLAGLLHGAGGSERATP